MNCKKPVSLALSLALAASLAAPAAAAGEPWYAEAQTYVTEKGYMVGTNNGFEPMGTVTRAMVYQTLWNMEGKPVVEAPAEHLLQLNEAVSGVSGHWWESSARWAYSVGMTTGAEGGVYAGDRAVTRAEIVTIMYRYAQFKGEDVSVGEDTNILSYTDALDVAEWAVPAFQWGCGAGIISGKGGGYLDPTGTATRAELATVLMRMDRLMGDGYTEETVAIEVPETDGIPAHTIPAIVTLPEGEGPFPVVVMLHGTGSNKNEAGGGYDLAAPAMAKAGIASIRIDFMGNGDSTADYTDYCYTSANIDAKAAADYAASLAAVDGGKIAVMGWSQGGTNALLAAAAYPETFQAVITWSGALELDDGTELFGGKTFAQAYQEAKTNGYFEMTFDWRDSLHVGERWFREVAATDVLAETARLTVPVLAINGDLDTTVPMSNAEAIVKTAKNGRLCIIEGADHTYNIFAEADHGTMDKTIEAGIQFLREIFLAPESVSLADYLARHGDEWFLTGKTSYTIQGMMVSKETSFHNELEVTDYTAADDGVSVVLKGTVGEQWVSKLEKVMKTYTKADGTPVTAEDFAVKDTFIDLTTKAAPETNFALHVPTDVSVTVNTAWGDVLHTNLPNAPHGDGDYLVCPAGEDGQPDLSDVWVVNGAVFPTTYDLSHALPVSGTVTSVSKYGNVTTSVTADDLAAMGYEVGDILAVTVAGVTVEAPYGTGYSNVDNGNVIVLPDSAGNVTVAINMGNFSSTYNAPEGTAVSFLMAEKAGYLEEYTIRNIDALRTNVREDYDSDAVFANFRAVTVGDIAEGRLYRSSSPVNPELGRNTYADALAKEAGIKTVLNLADDEETMKGYEGYAESYYSTLSVIPLNMGVDFAAEDFNAKLKEGLVYLSEHEGPYLVHCNEGKDRAGFVSALLEALCGAGLDEIVEDYMRSYENYYHVENHSDRWTRIAQSNIIKSLCAISGVDSEEALNKADLQKAAETYLTGTVGLTAEQVSAVRDALTK